MNEQEQERQLQCESLLASRAAEIDRLKEDLAHLTALHTEVSGRNVTLQCQVVEKDAEIAKLKKTVSTDEGIGWSFKRITDRLEFELNVERERSRALVEAVQRAMDERILCHPKVEADAMETLEVIMKELAAYRKAVEK